MGPDKNVCGVRGGDKEMWPREMPCPYCGQQSIYVYSNRDVYWCQSENRDISALEWRGLRKP